MYHNDLFVRNFPWPPTTQQAEAFELLAEFIGQEDNYDAFILKGYAGTGKTTMISTLVKSLAAFHKRSVLLAPTGRAAKVMSQYSGKKAWTIHKKIYRKKSALSLDFNFELADNMHENTVFIIDESSMISNEQSFSQRKSLLGDLIAYVKRGKSCHLLFVGDTAQLPPVGYIESPALDPDRLAALFGLRTLIYELREVVRQARNSGILVNATIIREQIEALNTDSNPSEGENSSIPKFVTRGFKDIFRMGGERFIEGLNYAYDKYGMENTLVICRSNKQAMLYNQHIRNSILFRDEELSGGDYIMIVRNNYHWLAQHHPDTNSFIANGDMATIRRVRNIHEQYGFRFADVTLEFADMDEAETIECRVMLDTLHSDSPNLTTDDNKLLYERILEDYMDEAPDQKSRLALLKADPYYNALQIKFAMAITCHKSQGGQWDAVFVDQGFIQEEQVDKEFLRWLYTACTRAKQELFLVNFNKIFFEQ